MKINIACIILCTIINKDYCMERENNPFQISKKNKELTRQSQLLEEKIKHAKDCEEKISSQSISKLESIKRSLSKNKELIKKEESEISLINVLKKTNHLTIPSTDTIQEEHEPKKKHKKTKAEKLEKWAEKNQYFVNKFYITKEILDLPWDKFLEKLVNIFIPENINYRIIGYNNKNNIIEIPTIRVLEDILKLKKSDWSKKIQELEQLQELLLEDNIFDFIQLLLFIKDKHALMYTNQLSETLYQKELINVYKSTNDFLNIEKVMTNERNSERKKEITESLKKGDPGKIEILKKLDFDLDPSLLKYIQPSNIEKLIIENSFKKFICQDKTNEEHNIALQGVLIFNRESNQIVMKTIACNTYDSNTLVNRGFELVKGKNIFNSLNKINPENYFIFAVPYCHFKISTLGLETINTNKLNCQELKSLINLLKIKSS